MKDGLTELAMLFKGRDNVTHPSVTTGFIMSPPPNPQIQLNDVILLDWENLIFAYRPHDYYKDGDEVILIPTRDEQLFFVIDKAVRF